MSGNYPPGVTGREYAIAGADWSGSSSVECRKPCTITMAPHGFPDLIVPGIDLDECPFEGDVDAEVYRGVRTWTCPVCAHQHEDEIDDEPDPDAARDAARDRMED